MPDPDALRREMVDRLTEAGELPTEWRPAFVAVPRHVFLPDLVWQQDDATESRCNLIPLRRDDDPDRWLELAYADDAVITQVDVEPGNRVLEIGTGTGYNAALLAHRLSPENVTTVEVDPTLAERAHQALTDAGHGAVRVITADGTHGHPPGAPYDRIISTVSVRRFPYSWVRQTRPGGRIVTPWAQLYFPALVAFTVGDDGTATGSVADPGMDFMALRDQRIPRVSVAKVMGGGEDTALASTTELHPYDVAGDSDAAFAIGQRVPNCTQRYWRPDEQDDHGPSGCSTSGRARGPGYAMTPIPMACTRSARAVPVDFGMRSRPPTAGGLTRAAPPRTGGGSR